MIPFRNESAIVDIKTDVLIVGAGVVGCAAAYYLAREGVEVAVLDRDEIGRGASSRNAGSLHQQLMPFIFRVGSNEERQARISTLPLMVAASDVWLELSQELGIDIEMRIMGGLMVATTSDQMEFLTEKVALEREQGLDVHIISGNELRTLAPYLAPSIIGAEYAPGEGKINPLRAITGLIRQAKKLGVRFFRCQEVLDIEKNNLGFTSLLTNGHVHCHRIINAAGAWANEVANKMGLSLPVELNCVQSNITERTSPLIGHLVCHAEKILSLKQVADGGVIIGGGWPAKLCPKTRSLEIIFDNVVSNVSLAKEVVPELRNVRLLRSWAGVNIKSNGKPILGQTSGLPGFYNAIPPDAGLTMGPICAKLVAEQILGRTPTFDINDFSVE